MLEEMSLASGKETNYGCNLTTEMEPQPPKMTNGRVGSKDNWNA